MSEPIKDGGPAFPCDWKDFQPNTGVQVAREQFFGITKRDWFAAHALMGLLANPNYGAPDPSRDAVTAYHEADAMIAASEPKKESAP